jgi:hypothetical protein
MKKILLVFTAALLVTATNAQSTKEEKKNKFRNFSATSNGVRSTNYSFSMSSGTYTNLVNPISLNNNEVWDDPEFMVDIPFPFYLNNTLLTSLSFDGLGGVLLGVSPSAPDLFEILMAFNTDLIDRGYDDEVSVSPLSYLVTGNTGSQILKIEWQNVGSYDDDSRSMYINFQVWLYEGSNNIECHFGPGMINDPATFYYDQSGAWIGFYTFNTVDEEPLNIHFLTGPVANPTLVHAVDEIEAITGTPSNGTVYRFTSATAGVNSLGKSSTKIFPNPANDVITIATTDLLEQAYQITDITGKVVKTGFLLNTQEKVNISDLNSGIYIFKIENSDSRYKIVKN